MRKPKVGKFKLKRTKGELAKNIQIVLPLIEELTDRKLMPLCLIGMEVNEKGETEIWVATVSDDKATEDATHEIFKIMHEHFLNNKSHPPHEKISTH